MAYAPGMYVFPGGNVEPRDSDESVRWVGPSPQTWAQHFDTSENLARALVCAAVRETFEEAGILLAGPSGTSVVSDTSADGWLADRETMERGALSLAEMLRRRALVLRADLLRPWAHWITPESEPRRFDTRFFLAVMPEGQRVGELTSEADRASWVPIAEALAAVEAGRAAMLPPTAFMCRTLMEFQETEEALRHAESRSIATVRPRIIVDGDERFIELEL